MVILLRIGKRREREKWRGGKEEREEWREVKRGEGKERD